MAEVQIRNNVSCIPTEIFALSLILISFSQQASNPQRMWDEHEL